MVVDGGSDGTDGVLYWICRGYTMAVDYGDILMTFESPEMRDGELKFNLLEMIGACIAVGSLIIFQSCGMAHLLSGHPCKSIEWQDYLFYSGLCIGNTIYSIGLFYSSDDNRDRRLAKFFIGTGIIMCMIGMLLLKYMSLCKW